MIYSDEIKNPATAEIVRRIPVAGGTIKFGTPAYAAQYANLQEPRRLWLSATVDF